MCILYYFVYIGIFDSYDDIISVHSCHVGEIVWYMQGMELMIVYNGNIDGMWISLWRSMICMNLEDMCYGRIYERWGMEAVDPNKWWLYIG